jgi:hypothetical protein
MGPSYTSDSITNDISFEDTSDNDEEIVSKIYATAGNKNTNEFKLNNIDDVDMDDI